MISLYLLLLNLLVLPLDSQSRDCGMFLFRVEYQMFPMGYSCIVEIREECDGSYLFFQERERETTRTSKARMEQLILELEAIDTTKYNGLENLYLNDGMLIEYTYLTRDDHLFRHTLHLPAIKEEQIISIIEEMHVIELLESLAKETLGAEKLSEFFRHKEYYQIDRN